MIIKRQLTLLGPDAEDASKGRERVHVSISTNVDNASTRAEIDSLFKVILAHMTNLPHVVLDTREP